MPELKLGLGDTLRWMSSTEPTRNVVITIFLEFPTTPDAGVLQQLGSMSYETAEDMSRRLGARKWDFKVDVRA